MPLSTVGPKRNGYGAKNRRGTKLQALSRSRPTQGILLRRSSRLASLQHQRKDGRGFHASLSESNLCVRCRSIDFVSIFQTSVPKGQMWAEDQIIFDLGILTDATPCSLCCFFYNIRTQEDDRERRTFLLRLSSITPFGKLLADKSKSTVALRVTPTFTRHRMWSIDRVWGDGCILPLSAQALPSGQVLASLVPPFIDFGLLQAWLKRCDTHHSSQCQRKTATRTATRTVLPHCIDCYSREIVQIRSDDEYIALSYVWGPVQQDEDLTSTGSLPELAPKVVEDALIVVKKLGKRYLWVDRFCIDQSDTSKKEELIRSMDRVFEGAYTTIVACAGSDASYGLPGVTDRPRKEQPAAVTPTGTLASSLPLLVNILKRSTWATRGWTYQEAFLSPRMIFFADEQAYFVCSSASWCEAVVPKQETDRFGIPPIHEIMRSVAGDEYHSTEEISQLLAHIVAFSQRTLSYEQDALDAFRGLLSRLRYHTYYGLPLWGSETLLDGPSLEAQILRQEQPSLQSLFWRPRQPMSLSRRHAFPSWSWAGWSGAISYSWFFIPHSVYPQASIWVTNSDGGPMSLTGLVLSARDRKTLPELSPYLYIDSLVVTLQSIDIGNHDTTFVVCPCHPSSAHTGAFDKRMGFWGSMYICHWPPGKSDTGRHRIADRSWESVLLYEARNQCIFLVIDWIDESQGMAYRVGSLDLPIALEELERLLPLIPHSRRRIRLE